MEAYKNKNKIKRETSGEELSTGAAAPQERAED
jgi:hypothetical protein